MMAEATMKIRTMILTGSLTVAIFAVLAIAASATPLGAAASPGAVMQQDDTLIVQVQRHRRGGPGPGPGRRGGDRGRGDDGAAAALGIMGLFIGTVIATQAQRQQAVNYCASRFRSFDPQSMTYLGFDGRRHSCP
jgi:hypothetical protein